MPLKTGEIPLPLYKDKSIGGVIVLCVVILLLLTGQNIYSTYIAPWLIEVGGFEPDVVPFMLFLFGGAGAIGLVLAGLVTDRYPRRGLIGASIAVALSVTVLAIASTNTVVVVIAFIAWGVTFGGIPAMLQTRMLHTASFRMRDLAAALQTTAFNIGIGGGALIGGLVLEGPGLHALPLFDVAFLVSGVVLFLVFDAVRSARLRAAA